MSVSCLAFGDFFELDAATILEHFVQLVESPSSRKYMASLMSRADLASGRKRVQKLIRNVLESS